jgi:acid phosphatase type 7
LSKVQAKAGAACACLAAASALAWPAHAQSERPAIVYAAGDIAYCATSDARWSRAAITAGLLAARLEREAGAAVLLLGDNVYPRGALADYQRCYQPTWGRFKARTHPAPGNREYYTGGAAGYFQYFGAAAGAGYYRLQLGAWQLYSLDSNLSGAAWDAQLAWLKSELARHPAACTLAYWHHPLYSSGGHGSIGAMRALWEVLYQAGAEIVLSGHDHHYERFAPQDGAGRLDRARGMRQFVVGTGGAFATPLLWPLAHSEARDSNRIGVLRLALGEGRYRWEFLAAARYDGAEDSPGATPDRGGGECH